MPDDRRYPALEIDLSQIRRNVRTVTDVCHRAGISVVGVTKGCSGLPPIARAFLDGGVDLLGDSRVENLALLRDLPVPKMLLRIPMLSQAADVVRQADVSLNSEYSAIAALSAEAARQGRPHQVILMIDLGDLREGLLDAEAALRTIERILRLEAIRLTGIGTNLTCYGGVIPTPEMMTGLLALRNRAERELGCSIPIVSGGNSSSFHLIARGTMPPGINQVRLGESLLLGNERAFWQRIEGTSNAALRLRAEIVEVQDKPSVPIGRRGRTTFDHMPEFPDRGVRRRALCAVGKQDVDPNDLTPEDPGLQILGGSSDLVIVDITGSPIPYQVGDTIGFLLRYYGIVRLTTSRYVARVFL